MDIIKHLDFLDPKGYGKEISIVGVGAVGSRVAEQIARLGFTKITIYDFDKVESVNVANQLFVHDDIGLSKVDAVERHLLAINPNIKVKKFASGWKGHPLSGAVFIAVDSIDLRRKITTSNMFNDNIDVMFDGRMRLTDAQYFGAVWSDQDSREAFLNSMQFSDEEAEAGTPVSACGTTLSVVPTVVTLASIITANFINYINTGKVQSLALVDPFNGVLNAMTF